MYSIGEVSKLLNIPTTTLRYYDSYGLFPNITRSKAGKRVFSNREIQTLKIIEYLKISGMAMKDIKIFLIWCNEGNDSLEKRRNMFYQRKKAIDDQIEKLMQTKKIIEYKCWYYDTALANKSEDYVDSLPTESIPRHIAEIKKML